MNIFGENTKHMNFKQYENNINNTIISVMKYIKVDKWDDSNEMPLNDDIMCKLRDVFVNAYEEHNTIKAQQLFSLFRNTKKDMCDEYVNVIKKIYGFFRELNVKDFYLVEDNFVEDNLQAQYNLVRIKFWWTGLQILIIKLEYIIVKGVCLDT